MCKNCRRTKCVCEQKKWTKRNFQLENLKVVQSKTWLRTFQNVTIYGLELILEIQVLFLKFFNGFIRIANDVTQPLVRFFLLTCLWMWVCNFSSWGQVRTSAAYCGNKNYVSFGKHFKDFPVNIYRFSLALHNFHKTPS